MSQRCRYRHHVYVVELSDRVWNEPSFRKANPDYLDLPHFRGRFRL